MNQRRKLLLALAASPIALARAQPAKPGAKPVRVAILRHARGGRTQTKVFTDTMRDLGWIEGKNIVYDAAYTEGELNRLPELAAELIARRPDLIYLQSNEEARAAFAQTRTIPIVFAAVVDPIAEGFVKSLAKPGGNVSGVTTIGWELGGKRMQLLRETLPNTGRIAVLTHGQRKDSLKELQLARQAAGSGVRVIPVHVEHDSELDAALATLAEHKPEALLMPHIAFFMSNSKRILEVTGRHRIPLVAHRSEIADNGALMTYSSNLLEQIRRAAHLVDRVLKGAKPADIPVEQPTKFELVVNIKTAKALGITIPQSVLLQASRVIE